MSLRDVGRWGVLPKAPGCGDGYSTRMREPPFRAVELSQAAWHMAVNAAHGDSAAGDSWDELISCGVADAEGHLHVMWRHALECHTSSPAGFRVTAAYHGIVVQTDVTMSADGTVTSLRQRRVDIPEQDEVAEVEATVEFAVSIGHPWPLVRRGLPPLASMQADPLQTPLDRIAAFDLQAELAKSGAPLGPDLAAAAAALDEEVLARAGIIVYAEINGGMALGTQLWYQLPHELVRVDDAAQIHRVEPGDLGFYVVYQALGIEDLLSKAGVR